MASRQSRRQLQFTGFEMTVIGVSFVFTVTCVFLLGLMVGKKNASYHAPREDRVARVPVDDFTRYKRPAAVPAPGAANASNSSSAGEAPAAKPEAPVAAAAAAAAKPSAAVAAAPPTAEPAVTPASAKADTAAKDAASAKEATAKELAAKEAAAKEKEKEKAEEPATGRGYTVQILATRKQADADALVRKLKSRGYAAYIKKVSEGEGSWYRVRVGSYGGFSEARAMADKCRRDLGLGQAFVSTE